MLACEPKGWRRSCSPVRFSCWLGARRGGARRQLRETGQPGSFASSLCCRRFAINFRRSRVLFFSREFYVIVLRLRDLATASSAGGQGSSARTPAPPAPSHGLG